MIKSRKILRWPLLAIVVCTFFAGEAMAQRERQIEAPAQSDYGSKFADQLRSLFGRFRDADLRRAFSAALPIQCSDLISGDGEWRPVAFFNEDRKLGEWYYSSIEEVRAEFSAYIFKGTCRTETSTVQVVTKAPVQESLEAYSAAKIDAKDVIVNVNAPVNASFDRRTEAYQFDLPYLYVVRGRGGSSPVYSLFAAKASDRYATDAINLWDCKRVSATDVTFQFLICQTWTAPRDSRVRNESKPSFGSFAYFILSDGREATTSVKLSFGGPGESKAPEEALDAPAAAAAVTNRSTDSGPQDRPAISAPSVWQIPDPATMLAAVAGNEFRIRFSSQTWANKINSSQLLVDQKMSAPGGSNPVAAGDHCIWRPASSPLVSRALAAEPDSVVAYALKAMDGEKTKPASMTFDLKTFTGSPIGTLQCFFQKTESAGAIPVDRWVNIVGGHLILEVRP